MELHGNCLRCNCTGHLLLQVFSTSMNTFYVFIFLTLYSNYFAVPILMTLFLVEVSYTMTTMLSAISYVSILYKLELYCQILVELSK
uniref:Uncharacterized protein n=1 Tax=Lepeophtheirus salmonis TaxID=72036 RepID=A0A0K2U4X0_LEPSM